MAVEALKALAADPERLKGQDLAERIGTTVSFVAQVVNPLVRAGWVSSDPGPSGGYSLEHELASISLLQVIEAVEGPTEPGRCVLIDRPCDEQEPCALHAPWTRARGLLLDELASTTVADAHSFRSPS